MHHDNLEAFLRHRGGRLAKGPVALIFAEDLVEVASTLRHHLDLGFREVLLFAPDALDLEAELEAQVERIGFRIEGPDAHLPLVNRVIEAAPGQWLYYGFNAEYLFFPFCESRSIGEMLAFHTEERREAMLTTVVDLYAGDLGAAPDGVSREGAHLDGKGYYSEPRLGEDGKPLERQVNIFGGLRWRFEEHVPPTRRRIDRIGLFRAKTGLNLHADHTLSEPEMNTIACPWHHNLTAAICSFRAAKALKSNAGTGFDVAHFTWPDARPFSWNSQQLMDLGLMEPGQWF
ncbi:MAG: hypothetical protein HUJ27_10780 [Rhodobacteraceae bacterium]|nr:hypothetical protein [Paracoccaceae bacterium]